MKLSSLPENLVSLHSQEEQLREKAVALIAGDPRLSLHLNVVEQAIDLTDLLRQIHTNDEDFKVLQVLGMRLFNAFGASLKLTLSCYHQNTVILMRDMLETIFLIDLFRGDPALIARRRFADKTERMNVFSPRGVREALDQRDGLATRKRAQLYTLFSELAAHPNMKSVYMMRPRKDGDAVSGPFMEASTLEAVLSELGRVAVQAGELIDLFFPALWVRADAAREEFASTKKSWMDTFYPKAQNP